jgi:hypothetical protein
MASTYTTDLAIQLMATGENAGTWGQITNTNLVVIQQAIAGYQAISIAGGAQTTALVMTQNAVSTARNAVLKLTGTITGNQIVTVPNGIEKTWIVSNGTVGAFTVNFKYASTGTGQTWTTTDKGIKLLYSDGTDIQVVDLSTLSGTVATAQIANFAVGTSQLATNAVTAVKITQSTITQAKLASNSVGATQIIQSTITQAKLAANSVGANQLISTGVTAASYTLSSITVDADGRITAASSGSAASGSLQPVLTSIGPASGTYTAGPAVTYAGFYMYAGGGGSGSDSFNPDVGNATGGSGGTGGYGYYGKTITQPFSQPYSVGGGGPARGTGGSTSVGNVGTVTGGNGGNNAPYYAQPGNPGSAGAQPGATFVSNIRTLVTGTPYGNPGNPAPSGGPGGAGALIIFENSGT